ncbi:hypothetical protein BG015_004423, partial [Linnemannia schmuckeri]
YATALLRLASPITRTVARAVTRAIESSLARVTTQSIFLAEPTQERRRPFSRMLTGTLLRRPAQVPHALHFLDQALEDSPLIETQRFRSPYSPACHARIYHAVSASGTPLTQAQAEARLIPNSIMASSTSGCSEKNKPQCISYEGILSGTVDGVITLKKTACVPSLVITGGTEVGHPGGAYSHSNGYKVDVRHQPGLDNYIKTVFPRIANGEMGTRSGKPIGKSVL